MATTADDYSDNTQTTGSLTTDATVTGTIEQFGDTDWFKVWLNAGVTYQFNLYGAPTGQGTLPGNSGTLLTLLAADGYPAIYRPAFGLGNSMPSLPYTPLQDGYYFVTIQGYANGTYTLGASVIANDDHGDMPASATPATVGASMTGTIGAANDHDWFKVRLEAGKLYSGALTGTAASSVGDLKVTLLDSTGQSVNVDGFLTGGGNTPYTISGALDATGDYYIGVTSAKAAGNYRLTLSEARDDFGSAADNSGKINIGRQVSGVINLANDRDWFKIHLDAGTPYAFSLAADDTAHQLRLIDLTGRSYPISSDWPIVPSATGDYHIQVTGATGAYTLNTRILPDDHGETAATAGELTVGQTVQGRFDYQGDRDAYLLQVEAGHLYQVTLTRPDGLSGATYASALPTGGAAIQRIENGYNPPPNVQKFKALTSGVMEVDAYIDSAAPANYSLSVMQLGVDDHGDEEASASALPLGATVNGILESNGDYDAFKIHLEAGVSYQVRTGGALAANTFGGALRLSTGKEINTSKFGYSANITPYATGDYYLYASAPNTTGAYTLSLTALADDYTANASTTGKLEIGGTASGKLDADNDRDWLAVNLEAGKVYWFDRTSTSGAQASLSLLDAAGNQLAAATSTIKTVSFTPTTSGTYYVQAATSKEAWYMSNGAVPGAYTISARLGQTDDFPLPTPLALGVQQTGRIELPGDQDSFLMNLQAGHFYRVTLEMRNSSGAFALVSNALQIRGLDKVAYASMLYEPDVQKIYQASSTGVYELPIALYSDSEGRDYRIRVTDLGADDTYWGATTALELGKRHSGTLEVPRDTDYYTLALKKGQTVSVSLLGAADGAGTLPMSDKQALLRIYDKNGFERGSGYPFVNLSNTAKFTPDADGVYDIRVKDFYNGQTGSYTIIATDVAADQVAPQMLRPPISSDVSLDGTIRVTFNEGVQRTTPYYYSSPLTVKDSLGMAIIQVTGSDDRSGKQLQFTGADMTLKAGKMLMPGETYEVKIPKAYVTDMAGNAPANDIAFTVQAPQGAAGPDAGNGIYAGNLDGRSIDGGAGFDRAVYLGYAGMYVVKGAAGGYTVAPYDSGRAGAKADTLAGIERIHFTLSNDVLALDVDGVAGKAYRLYQSAFDRAPDKAGIGFWINAMEKGGATLLQVAQGFIASDEFNTKYGANASDIDFVTRLYKNVLHRAGEPAGMEYWTGKLAAGANRAEVLAAFSESPENAAGVAKLIGNGFLYTPFG